MSTFIHVTPLDMAAPVIMGVLNVTPDSFSDGGRYADLDGAVAHACGCGPMVPTSWMSAASLPVRVRSGSIRTSSAARVLPVIRELAAAGVPMSIDTTRAVVAAAALEAGVVLVNDVSGGLADPDMARVVADAGCPWVLMHWRGHSDRMAASRRVRGRGERGVRRTARAGRRGGRRRRGSAIG